MAVEMEGLEFQIEATSDEAIKGISALSSTFSMLYLTGYLFPCWPTLL